MCTKHGLDTVKIKKAPAWRHAFVTFRNDEAREGAIKTLNQMTHKGRVLDVGYASARDDPFRQNNGKRGQDGGDQRPGKRQKQDEGSATFVAQEMRLSGPARLPPAPPPRPPNASIAKRPIACGAAGTWPCPHHASRWRARGVHTRVPPAVPGPALPLIEQLYNKVTPLWELPYEKQLRQKQDGMRKSLLKVFKQFPEPLPAWAVKGKKHHGGLFAPMTDICPSPVIEGYRNKCEFSIGSAGGDNTMANVVVGHMVGSYTLGASCGLCCPCADAAPVATPLAQRPQLAAGRCPPLPPPPPKSSQTLLCTRTHTRTHHHQRSSSPFPHALCLCPPALFCIFLEDLWWDAHGLASPNRGSAVHPPRGRWHLIRRRTVRWAAAGNLDVVAPDGCLHINKQTNSIRAKFQEFLRTSPLAFYDQVNHKGVWRSLTLRTNQAGEALAMLTLDQEQASKEAMAAEEARLAAFMQADGLAELKLVSLLVQNNASVSGTLEAGEEPRVLYGPPYLEETMCGHRFRISPAAFFQVNTKGAEKLLEKIRVSCGVLDEDTTLLDICCGTGTIGISLAKAVRRVIGVDICEASIKNARTNAEINNIDNVKFYAGKAEDVIKDILAESGVKKVGGAGHAPAQQTEKGRVIGIVDPPRAGLHKSVMMNIRKATELKHLIFIACNIKAAGANVIDLCRPTSKRFKGLPFQLIQASPVDLFPHTPHCELLLIFERLGPDGKLASASASTSAGPSTGSAAVSRAGSASAGSGTAAATSTAPAATACDYSATNAGYGAAARAARSQEAA